MTPSLAELVAELRRLEKEATPGPWCWSDVGEKGNEWAMGVAVDDDDRPMAGHIGRDEGVPADYVCEAGSSGNFADPSLIVAARNGLGQLLDAADENERLRALLGECRGLLAEFTSSCDPEDVVGDLFDRIETELRPQTGEAKP